MNNSETTRQWQIPDEQFEGFLEVFERYVESSFGARDVGEDVVNSACDEITGGDHELLKELYPRMLSKYLLEFLEFLDTQSFRDLFSGDVEKVAKSLEEGCVDRLVYFARILRDLGTERASDLRFDHPPFKRVEIGDDPDWRRYIIIAQNFAHNMSHLFKINAIAANLPDFEGFEKKRAKGKDMTWLVNYVADFGRPLDLYIEALRYFERLVRGEDLREGVDVGDIIVSPQMTLLMNRVSLDKFPIQVKGPKIEVGSADGVGLRQNLYELTKNTVRRDKISRDRLKSMAESDEIYLNLCYDYVEVDGVRYIVVLVDDKGTPINVNGIIDKLTGELGYHPYELRDMNLGDLMDLLSERNLSIPLEGGEITSSGVGVHAAKTEIEAHNGRMFYASGRSGVSCSVFLPADGKNSISKVPDFSGKQLAQVYSQLCVSEYFGPEMAGKVLRGILPVDVQDDIGEITEVVGTQTGMALGVA